MKPVLVVSVVLPVATLLVLAGTLTACALSDVMPNDESEDARTQLSQLPESQQIVKETFLGKDTTIKTALVGSVTVGYASQSDYENGKHPTSPIVTLTRGASITHTLTVANRSKVYITGGRIGFRERNTYGNNYGGEVLAGDKSSVVFSGGMAHSLSATGQSTVTLTGGTIGAMVIVGEHGTLNLKGGTMKGEISLGPGGTLNVFGTNLNKKLLRPGETKYSASYADQADQYVLSGTLSDGTALAGKVLLVSKTGGSKVNFIKGTS